NGAWSAASLRPLLLHFDGFRVRCLCFKNFALIFTDL
uniref:UDP-glucuronate decarboxylase n=1 Tax=Parascaris univalens TaxID=6257 RepID=A0A915AU01_PARUN